MTTLPILFSPIFLSHGQGCGQITTFSDALRRVEGPRELANAPVRQIGKTGPNPELQSEFNAFTEHALDDSRAQGYPDAPHREVALPAPGRRVVSERSPHVNEMPMALAALRISAGIDAWA